MQFDVITKWLLNRLTPYRVRRLSEEAALITREGVDPNDDLYAYLNRSELLGCLNRAHVQVVIDVGANKGQFAQFLRSAGYAGQIHSFEPISSVFLELKAKADLDPLWTVHQVGLGSVNQTLEINVAESTPFSSFLPTAEFSTEHFGDKSRTMRRETVEVRRLDQYAREHRIGLAERNAFVKLDTQGYDLEVFEGLVPLLSSVKLLQSEISLIPIYEGMPHWTVSIDRFERAGFSIVGMYPVSRKAGAIIEYDCLMISDDLL